MEHLRKLLSGNIPFPARGRGFLVDTGLGFLARETLDALGPERLVLRERDLRAARRMSLELPDLQVEHDHAVTVEPGDFVILPVEKNRQALFHRLESLANVLGPEGRIFLYGSKREGIKPAQSLLVEHCAELESFSKAGLRLLNIRPGEGSDWNLTPLPKFYEAEARGQRVRVAASPGLFSWDHLDLASAALLESCKPRAGDRLLDLGCASGVIAAIMLAEGKVESAVCVDSDALALDTCRRTLALNGIDPGRVEVLADDAGRDLPDRSCNLVLSNPPLHRGFSSEIAAPRQFVLESWRVLAAKGRAYFVGPVSLKLGRLLEEVFGNAELLMDDPRFQVWRAYKKRLPRVRREENLRAGSNSRGQS